VSSTGSLRITGTSADTTRRISRGGRALRKGRGSTGWPCDEKGVAMTREILSGLSLDGALLRECAGGTGFGTKKNPIRKGSSTSSGNGVEARENGHGRGFPATTWRRGGRPAPSPAGVTLRPGAPGSAERRPTSPSRPLPRTVTPVRPAG